MHKTTLYRKLKELEAKYIEDREKLHKQMDPNHVYNAAIKHDEDFLRYLGSFALFPYPEIYDHRQHRARTTRSSAGTRQRSSGRRNPSIQEAVEIFFSSLGE